MQQLENAVEHIGQGLLGRALGLAVALEPGLNQLNIPVAKVTPGKFVQLLGGFAHAVVVELLAHAAQSFGDSERESSDRLALRSSAAAGHAQAGRRLPVQVHHHKAGGIPQLVGKVA